MSEELHAKYQKLATAYAEVKQKNAVLKSAVQELTQKQGQGSAAAGMGGGGGNSSLKVSQLQKKMKEGEQALRVQAQDMDALRFHNQQLTKRVEVLQEEENRRSAEKGGKKKKGTAEVEAMHLQEEELRRKIRENEQLHRKMGEMKRESDREIRQLKEQLQTVQRTLKSGDESRRTVAEEAQRSRENVHKESAGLIERIGVLEIELQTSRTGHRTSLTDIEAKLSRTETDNQRLRRLAANQRGKHGFDDIAHAAFNELNVPVVDLFKQRGVDQIKKEAQALIRQYANGFSNLLSYLEQAVPTGDVWGGMGRATDEYRATLDGHAQDLKPLDHSFTAFAEGKTSLSPFSDVFFTFSRYISKFAQAFGRFVQHQVASPDCTPTLRDANLAVAEAFRNVGSQLDRLAGLCNVIAKETGGGNLQQSMYSIVGYLNDLLHEHRTARENAAIKVQQEQGLGWLDSSTSTVIVSTLLMLEQSVEALAAVLSNGHDVLVGGGQSSIRGAPMQSADTCRKPGLLQHLQGRATQYMALLRCDAPDSVPYTEALALRDGRGAVPSFSASERADTSTSDAAARVYQERIANLEQEREHAALEFQMLSMKLQVYADDDGEGPRVESIHSGGTTGGASTMEMDVLKKHYDERIQLLTNQLRMADSKAVTYYDECRSIALRLEYMRNSQVKQGEEYKNVNGTIARLKEDLESTKRNYEEQLNTMTEHIMEMNDKQQQQPGPGRDVGVKAKKGGRRTSKKTPGQEAEM